jgi:hypothetical protein
MKPCLFSSGGVGIVVNSLAIDSSPACSAHRLAGRCCYAGGQHAARPLQGACALAGAHRYAGARRCPANSLLRSRLRPCQTKKSIDFIWHVMDRDWYKCANDPAQAWTQLFTADIQQCLKRLGHRPGGWASVFRTLRRMPLTCSMQDRPAHRTAPAPTVGARPAGSAAELTPCPRRPGQCRGLSPAP